MQWVICRKMLQMQSKWMQLKNSFDPWPPFHQGECSSTPHSQFSRRLLPKSLSVMADKSGGKIERGDHSFGRRLPNQGHFSGCAGKTTKIKIPWAKCKKGKGSCRKSSICGERQIWPPPAQWNFHLSIVELPRTRVSGLWIRRIPKWNFPSIADPKLERPGSFHLINAPKFCVDFTKVAGLHVGNLNLQSTGSLFFVWALFLHLTFPSWIQLKWLISRIPLPLPLRKAAASLNTGFILTKLLETTSVNFVNECQYFRKHCEFRIWLLSLIGAHSFPWNKFYINLLKWNKTVFII